MLDACRGIVINATAPVTSSLTVAETEKRRHAAALQSASREDADAELCPFDLQITMGCRSDK